jgi:hypothetical protein
MELAARGWSSLMTTTGQYADRITPDNLKGMLEERRESFMMMPPCGAVWALENPMAGRAGSMASRGYARPKCWA